MKSRFTGARGVSISGGVGGIASFGPFPEGEVVDELRVYAVEDAAAGDTIVIDAVVASAAGTLANPTRRILDVAFSMNIVVGGTDNKVSELVVPVRHVISADGRFVNVSVVYAGASTVLVTLDSHFDPC